MATRNGRDYTINTDVNTQLRRRFWGKATLAEFSVNDKRETIAQADMKIGDKVWVGEAMG